MKVKISNIKFSTLDNLINSDIIKLHNNHQIVFGDKKKLYKQDSQSRIDISFDSVLIPSMNIHINTVSISHYDIEEDDYLPYMNGYIISDTYRNKDDYIECDTDLSSILKNYTNINDINNLICDITINI